MNVCGKVRFRARGLVLLELLVAGCVLAVLAAIAVPSFAAISERVKLRTAADALTTSLYAARGEAYRRGGHVTIARSMSTGCESRDGPSQWQCGWIVFADADEDGTRDADEDLIQAGHPPQGVEVTQTSGRPFLKLNAWGQFNGLTGLRFVVRSRTNASAVSAICISSGGRVQTWPGVDKCPA